MKPTYKPSREFFTKYFVGTNEQNFWIIKTGLLGHIKSIQKHKYRKNLQYAILEILDGIKAKEKEEIFELKMPPESHKNNQKFKFFNETNRKILKIRIMTFTEIFINE